VSTGTVVRIKRGGDDTKRARKRDNVARAEDELRQSDWMGRLLSLAKE
jgi:hypothetical protein